MSATAVRIRPTWGLRAARLLRVALGEIERGAEAFAPISAAEACLLIEAGELPDDELDGYPFPTEEPEIDLTLCVCSPGLVERGGFSSKCEIHGPPKRESRG